MMKFNPLTGKFDMTGSSGEIYSAGEGIEITDENVINNTAQETGLIKNTYSSGEVLTIPGGYEYNVVSLKLEAGSEVEIEEGGSLNTI